MKSEIQPLKEVGKNAILEVIIATAFRRLIA